MGVGVRVLRGVGERLRRPGAGERLAWRAASVCCCWDGEWLRLRASVGGVEGAKPPLLLPTLDAEERLVLGGDL